MFSSMVKGPGFWVHEHHQGWRQQGLTIALVCLYGFSLAWGVLVCFYFPPFITISVSCLSCELQTVASDTKSTDLQRLLNQLA